MSPESLPDHADTGDPTSPEINGPELKLVRLRLALVVASTAMISGVLGAVVATVAVVGPFGQLADAVGAVPLPPATVLGLIFVASAWLMLRLARQVLRPAEELDAARRHFRQSLRIGAV